MSESSIVPLGNAAAVVVPAELLRELNLQVGDPVQVTLSEGRLVVSRAADVARQQLVNGLTEDLLQRRGDAYRRLA